MRSSLPKFERFLTLFPLFFLIRQIINIQNHSFIMKFRAVIQQDEDGMFVAECPSLPGCISQGKSREEALENVRDAIKGYLESLKRHNEPIPSRNISAR